MTEENISKLPEVLKKHMATLKRTSKDPSNGVFMTESKMQVVNFDKLPKTYAREMGLTAIPKSNDALYIDDNRWFFIEFKNGEVQKDDIYRKIYDSLIVLIELGMVDDFQFSRDNINYILVYNSQKYPCCPKSESREQNFGYFFKLANMEEKLFGAEAFEGYLFKEVHTYTKDLFQSRFVTVMESKEAGC